MKKQRIFLTGATGGMGFAGLQAFLKNEDAQELMILARPSEKNRELLKGFEARVELVWGDLTNYEDVLKCVRGADYVLHVGAFVSPEADYHPKRAMEINYGSTMNILTAIRECGQENTTKLVYIGTVAETGDRMPPIHRGRIGDPIKPSVYDYYAVSKIAAERAVIESGLKYWVSLRQTGIISKKMAEIDDAIMFHNCLDSKWYATRNFHGHYHPDSDKLEEYLHFRSDSMQYFYDAAMEGLGSTLGISRLLCKLPFGEKIIGGAIKKKFLKTARTEHGTVRFLEEGDEGKIAAYRGSRRAWEALPPISEFEHFTDWDTVVPIDHGYDDTKPERELCLVDVKQAAEFRGGACLSERMETGDWSGKLRFRCAFGHEFEASPRLVLQGGHWCDVCERESWNYYERAKRDPFFAQVWTP